MKSPSWSRRDFLKGASAATLSALAAGHARPLLGAQASAARRAATADTVIVLWMAGGMAGTETFDPKRYRPFEKGLPPDAFLSTFPSIDTHVDPIKFSAGLEKIAGVMDRGTLIRTYTAGDLGFILHSRHQFQWHTGYAPPQSVAAPHIGAIIAEWPIRHVTIVAGRPERAQALLDYARAQHPDIVIDLVGSDGATAALREARIIVCATTATSALFDAADARGDVAAVAVGTHSPTCCELPSELVGRSFVVVEERESALREAGDVVCAITAGFMTADDIAADLTEVAKRSVDVPATGSRVFKSMGMAWEDAVVSARIAEGVA